MVDQLNNRTWQHLLGLESIDVVRDWHMRIHNRELNTRRTTEIASSAKQAGEYFKTANAANTVRPLLTFYGIASLGRSALLLLRPCPASISFAPGSSNCRPSGRVAAKNLLSVVMALKLLIGRLRSLAISHFPSVQIGGLKLRTTAGFFDDFLKQTKNRICMHVHSSDVDWKLDYDQPPLGLEVSLEALLQSSVA